MKKQKETKIRMWEQIAKVDTVHKKILMTSVVKTPQFYVIESKLAPWIQVADDISQAALLLIRVQWSWLWVRFVRFQKLYFWHQAHAKAQIL